MRRQIKAKNRTIRYAVRVSRKARNIRLDAYYDGRFVLTIPRGIEEGTVRKFIREKTNWMLAQLRFFRNFEGGVFFRHDSRHYAKHKEQSRRFVHSRLEHYGKRYRISYNQVRIKNLRTTWGSCSEKGNLNFNYKLLFLPRSIAEYIVVHELCHLKEFNHSPRFWKLVAKTFPNYRTIEHQLRSRF